MDLNLDKKKFDDRLKNVDLEKRIESDETIIKERSEMGEIVENLDSFKGIDHNARLTSSAISSCLIIDELNNQGLLPNVSISTQFKKLSVSLNGLGRREKVEIVSANREQNAGTGFFQKLGNLFKPKAD